MDYLVPEEVAEENGISESKFIKFLEVHLKQVTTQGKMLDETMLRFRIEKNFGVVNEDVFNVLEQELRLTLDGH